MRNLRTLAVASALTMLASISFGQTGAAPSAPTADNQPAPMVLLVPVEIQNRALENGCWAQFYDERNFKGDVLTLVGPAQLDTVDKGTGRQFKRNIDSLVLGPKAMLKVYEHQLFRDKSVDFPANTRESGLVSKLGAGGRIQSLQLSCTS